MRHHLAFAALSGAAALLFAPAASAEVDETWTAVIASGTPADGSRLLAWFDGHARFRDGADELWVSILRPGVGWRVNGGLDVYAGYARVTQHRDQGDIEEDRIWQQAIYQMAKIGEVSVSGRTRLEQRFRETGDDTGWRLRQFVRASRPLPDTPVSVVVWDELFWSFNATDWGQASGYDQNRLFVGAAWRLQDNVRIEGGYLNHHVEGKNSVSRDNLAFNLFVNF